MPIIKVFLLYSSMKKDSKDFYGRFRSRPLALLLATQPLSLISTKMCYHFIWPILEVMAEIWFFFWENWRHQNFLLKSTDLYPTHILCITWQGNLTILRVDKFHALQSRCGHLLSLYNLNQFVTSAIARNKKMLYDNHRGRNGHFNWRLEFEAAIGIWKWVLQCSL